VADPPALIVATLVLCELHVTLPVKFCVELSENVPVAANCCAVPFAIDGFAGVTAIDTSVGAVTVNSVVPSTAPKAASILLIPVATPVANPPAVIVTKPVVCEVQVAEPVKFCVELSEKVPVAVNCSVVPFAIEGFAGVTATDTSVGPVTVRFVVPLTAPDVACIWLVPADTAVAEPPAPIVATPVVCEVQVTEPVKFCVELSEKVPVAVNCSVLPFAIEGFAGVTAIDTRVAEVTVSRVDPLTLPDVAMIMLVPAAFAVAIPPVAIVAALVFWDCQLTEPVRLFVELSL
jgi:hypothetical protein